MSDKELEVYKAHAESKNKYVYFLLAAAGAGIALAVNQTQGAVLAWAQVPLGGAVLCWALSFFSGCRHLVYLTAIQWKNLELLKVQMGQHPKVGTHPEAIQIATESLKGFMDADNEHASWLGDMQFWLVVAGGILFVAWHIIEMYLRLAAQHATAG